eukprot:2712052-Alexandrium_andersonii.AAC.1
MPRVIWRSHWCLCWGPRCPAGARVDCVLGVAPELQYSRVDVKSYTYGARPGVPKHLTTTSGRGLRRL